MASSENYLLYCLELLRKTEKITYRKMMGEYLLYSDGVLFGGVYDDRFLIKITPALKNNGLKEELPYSGAKPMYSIETENDEEIAELVRKTVENLK